MEGTDLWRTTAGLPAAVCKPLQTNSGFNIVTVNDVLDFELQKLDAEAKILKNTSVLAWGQP